MAHDIEIVYGIFVIWRDLVQLGYVKMEDDCTVTIGDFHVVYADHRNYVNDLKTRHPDSLPPHFKDRPEEKTYNYGSDCDEFALVCVGIKVGSIETSQYRVKTLSPTYTEIVAASEKFKATAPKDLLEVSGSPDLRFIPDD